MNIFLVPGLMTRAQFIDIATALINNSDVKYFVSNIFSQFDKNGDGFLDFEEFNQLKDSQVISNFAPFTYYKL